MSAQRSIEASNTEPVIHEPSRLPADHTRPAGFASRHIHLASDDASDTLDRFAWVDKTGRVALHRSPTRVNGKPFGDDYRVSIIVNGAAYRLYDDMVAPLKRIARAVSKLFIADPGIGDRLDRGDTKTDAAAIMAAISRAK
jgi:hypothetical protein